MRIKNGDVSTSLNAINRQKIKYPKIYFSTKERRLRKIGKILPQS